VRHFNEVLNFNETKQNIEINMKELSY
jgi:hypothetical protein